MFVCITVALVCSRWFNCKKLPQNKIKIDMFSLNPSGTKMDLIAFATNIVPGQCADSCSMNRFYTVGWLISKPHSDIPTLIMSMKWLKASELPETWLHQLVRVSVLQAIGHGFKSYIGLMFFSSKLKY